MRRKKALYTILFIAVTGALLFTVSCVNIGDLIPGSLIDSIWDVFGYNKPANLQALALSDTKMQLTWEDKVTGEDGFTIEYNIMGGPWSTLVTVDRNVEKYICIDLTPETLYMFQAYAFDAVGKSEYSDVAFASTQTTPEVGDPPESPSNLQAQAVSDSQILLQWVDHSLYEDGFVIEYKPDGGDYAQLADVVPNTTSYTSGGLTASKKYYYRVYSYHDTAGGSLPSNEASATTQAPADLPPVKPTNLQAAAISNMRIDLSWADMSNNEDGFNIEIRTSDTSFEPLAAVNPNVTSYKSTSLEPETQYFYRVYAYNSQGDSAYSTEASASTKPTPETAPEKPTNLQALTLSDVRISLAWTDNADDEDGFNIEIAESETEPAADSIFWQWAGSTTPNETSYIAGSLDADTTYWFRVNAYNFFDPSDYSAAATATTLQETGTAPQKPTNLVARTISDTVIEIEWWDASENEDGFNIVMATGESPGESDYTWRATVDPGVEEYLAGGLIPETEYHFKVNAFNSYGPSSYCDPASAETNPEVVTIPAAPTDLDATPVSVSQIDLVWIDNSDNEDGFNIEVSADGAQWGFLGIVNPDVTSYSVMGLVPELALWFRVNAFNGAGASGFSLPAKATTPAAPETAPDAPSALTAAAVSDTQILIGWTDNSDNEDGFNIVVAEDSQPLTDDGYTWVATVGPDTAHYLAGGLQASTLHYFKISAFNTVGTSYSADPASATTEVAPTLPPAAPTDLTAVAVSDIQIDLAWTDGSDNEDGFNIERAPESFPGSGIPGTYSWIAKRSPNTDSYSVAGLLPETRYWFRVYAFNQLGASGYTDPTADATTEATPTDPPAAPTGLSAYAIGDYSIELRWEDNADNEDDYIILVREGTAGSYVFNDKVDPDTVEWVVSGLEDGVTYYFKIYAMNRAGNSAFSNVAVETAVADTNVVVIVE